MNQTGIQRETRKLLDLHVALHRREWSNFAVRDILTRQKKNLIKSFKRNQRRANTVRIEGCVNSGTTKFNPIYNSYL